MAPTSPSPPVAPVTIRFPYRVSVAQYHKMGEAGVFNENEKGFSAKDAGKVGLTLRVRLETARHAERDGYFVSKTGGEPEKVELLEGILVEKTRRSPPEATAVSLLFKELNSRLPDDWGVRILCPITTADSEPDPAGAVVPGDPRLFMQRHPGPREVALVVEVSGRTLEQDRTDKLRIYARARLPIYWIVNILEDRIEVYTQPRSGKTPTYRQRRDYLPAEQIPLIIAGQEVGSIPVRDLLP